MADEVEWTDRDYAEADLTRLRAEYPERQLEIITYADRNMIVFGPTTGQVAILGRLAQSRTMDDVERIATFLDALEQLLVEREDRDWLAEQMIDAKMDVGDTTDIDDPTKPPSVLGLLRAITLPFVEQDNNRAGRRSKARRTR